MPRQSRITLYGPVRDIDATRPRWFYEVRHMDRWSPVLSARTPELRDNMRIKRADGRGQLLRAHPVQIRETDIGRNLDDLQDIYGVQE